MTQMSNLFVVCLGIGTVFVGLIIIIFMCKIVSAFCNIGTKNEKVQNVTQPTVQTQSKPIENRQEIIAAVSAAIAEELGKDISAIRILSFKKL